MGDYNWLDRKKYGEQSRQWWSLEWMNIHWKGERMMVCWGHCFVELKELLGKRKNYGPWGTVLAWIERFQKKINRIMVLGDHTWLNWKNLWWRIKSMMVPEGWYLIGLIDLWWEIEIMIVPGEP